MAEKPHLNPVKKFTQIKYTPRWADMNIFEFGKLVYYGTFNIFTLLYNFIKNISVYIHYPVVFQLDVFFWQYYCFFYNFPQRSLEKKAAKRDFSELIYGEIPYYSFDLIMQFIKPQKEQIFYDLGSGKGKLVFYAALKYGLQAYGIEILPTYNKVAQYKAKKMQLKNAHFLQADFTNTYFQDGAIFFVAMTCLNDETRKKLTDKLLEVRSGAYIITLTYPLENARFKKITQFKSGSSWGTATIYIYQKSF